MILSCSSGEKTTFVFLRGKFSFQIANTMENNTLYFDLEEMLKMAWFSTHVGFWTSWLQWQRFWGCTLTCFQVMGYMYALTWKLLIIGLLLCTFFLWEDQGHFLENDQISSGVDKKKGSEGGIGGEAWMRVIFAKFPLLSKIQNTSHKLLVRKTSNYHHCSQHAQRPKCTDFQVI